MGSEWKETTLGEFSPFNYGKGLPKRKRNSEGEIPVYGSNGITGYHDEALIEQGIIIGRKGSIGEVEYSEKPFWPIDTTFYVEESPERDIKFTYYLLKSLPLQEMNSDSAVPGLNRNAAHNLKIKVPDLNEQKRIGHILGTLDDKIELNQRMNETLEAIARAIFKSWFVDFDPVRAKMTGEPYPLPDEVMALFPDELVESEVGLIPKGWEVGRLSDEFKVVMGQSPPGKSYNEEGKGIAFFQGRTDFGFRYPSKRVFCTEPKRFADPGDTLISVRAPVGDINMAKERCCIGRGVAAVRHKSSRSSYTYYSMMDLQRRFKIFEAEGTVFGSIGKNDLNSLSIIIPSDELKNIFEELVKSNDEMILNNNCNNEDVNNIRDLLSAFWFED